MAASKKKATRKKAASKKAPSKKAPAKKEPSTRARKVKAGSGFKANVTALAKGTGTKVAMTGLPWVIAVGLGSLLLFKSRDSDAATAPVGAPPLNPNPPVGPAPAPVPEPAPIASKVNKQQRLDVEFRRVKPSEKIPRDILSNSKLHTHEPIGVIIFETSAINGKEYAYVLEQHDNLPPGDGGVSVYVHR